MINKENILKNAPFGYALHRIVLDKNGNPVDYKFIEVNETFEKFIGLKKDNIVGKTVKEAIPGIDKENFDWISFYGKVALENTEEIFEQYSEHLGKHYRVCAYSPRKEYFITIFTDITEEKLVEAHKFTVNIIATLREPFLVLDADLKVVSANESFYKTFLVSKEDTLGNFVFDLGNRQWDIPALRKLLLEILPNKSELVDFEIEHFFEDIGQKTILLNCKELKQEAGKEKMILLAMQDITESKQAEVNLISAKEKAEESDRLKSVFLATMNHELRTPLNHILGFSELISDMTDDNVIKEFSELTHKSGTNLLNLIEDIFDLAMIEQSEISIRQQQVFIRDIYLELKNGLQEVLSQSNKSNNISLEFKIDSSTIIKEINTDKPKVMQVMSNIIKNAVKFTHEGKITLSLILEEENYLSIKIKDTGIGIPKDKLKVIFEFFRQADDSHTRQHDGVGIGLAISQQIANAMGGVIKVESKPDIGSEFTYSFPVKLLENKMIDSQQENTSFLLLDLSEFKVLIVEDDSIGMGMMVNMLKPTKCKIITAANGKEALEAITVNPDINLILMDLKMPVMDGFDATRAIRKDFTDLPIIALTAYRLKKDKEKALDAGCNDIITKPISKEIIFKKLQDLLVK